MVQQPRSISGNRWEVAGERAEHWIELKNAERPGHPDEFFIPGFFKWMYGVEDQPNAKLNWQLLYVAAMDPRVNAGTVFECEYRAVIWQKQNGWNRSKSRQGFRNGFRIMDLAERIQLTDKKVWSNLISDWACGLSA